MTTGTDLQSQMQAVGWLCLALESDHPGYIAAQADEAEAGGYTDTAAGLRGLIVELCESGAS